LEENNEPKVSYASLLFVCVLTRFFLEVRDENFLVGTTAFRTLTFF